MRASTNNARREVQGLDSTDILLCLYRATVRENAPAERAAYLQLSLSRGARKPHGVVFLVAQLLRHAYRVSAAHAFPGEIVSDSERDNQTHTRARCYPSSSSGASSSGPGLASLRTALARLAPWADAATTARVQPLRAWAQALAQYWPTCALDRLKPHRPREETHKHRARRQMPHEPPSRQPVCPPK